MRLPPSSLDLFLPFSSSRASVAGKAALLRFRVDDVNDKWDSKPVRLWRSFLWITKPFPRIVKASAAAVTWSKLGELGPTITMPEDKRHVHLMEMKLELLFHFFVAFLDSAIQFSMLHVDLSGRNLFSTFLTGMNRRACSLKTCAPSFKQKRCGGD